jgi:hypothetical protein
MEAVCKACRYPSGDGKYCKHCSQPVEVKRITLGSLGHEVFHFFTHVDKGFPYTVKKLLREPGTMQREYLEGVRVKHQKPFSMFLISATIVALTLYWLNIILAKYYAAGDLKEALFFDKYMVLLLTGLVPVFAVLTYFFFYNSNYNFAEVVVFSSYTISFFLLLVTVVNFAKLINPEFESRYIEIPVTLIYSAITFKNFFPEGKRWLVICKGLICALVSFISIAALQDYLVEHF